MKITALSMVVFLLLHSIGFAQPTEPQVAAGKLMLKNRSSFSPDGRTRNPCWPIGWVPSAAAKSTQMPVEQVQVVAIPSSALVVSMTLIGSPSIAIVNNKEITVGSTLSINIEGVKADLKVLRIGDGFVDFDYSGKMIRATGGR